MKRSREELKAELMGRAEEVIDKFLDWHTHSQAPTLIEIEDLVLRLRKELGEGLTQAAVQEQEAVRPVPGPLCKGCGREMHYKGMKEVQVEGRTGVVKLERAYYYCDRCESGLFPPGPAAGVEGEPLE